MNRAVLLLFFLISATISNAQRFDGIIGAFEFSGQLYVSYQEVNTNRFLSKKVEGYLGTEVMATAFEAPVDFIYSSFYQRLFAVYQSSNGRFVAHSVHKVLDNSPSSAKAGFGVTFDPNRNRTMAAYLNANNEIVAFPVD